MVDRLERFFPKLQGTGWRVTSPQTDRYNCIAWCVGDVGNWWWPIGNYPRDHWPAGFVREETLAAFVTVFVALGFQQTTSEALEPGVEKIALFADSASKPTHAARQLADGKWTSKLDTSC